MANFKKHLIIYSSENQQVAEQMVIFFQGIGQEAMILERSVSDMSEQIGQIQAPEGCSVIFLITDNFLKSYGCMNGILQAAHKWGDAGKLIAIATEGVHSIEDGTQRSTATNFERVGDIIQYMNFWQDKYLVLRKEKRNREQDEELDEVIAITKEISADVGEFLRYIRGQGYARLEEFYEKNGAQNDQEEEEEEIEQGEIDPEELPEGAAFLDSSVAEKDINSPKPGERSLVEMIVNSSEELMAENADIGQDETYPEAELTEDELTDQILSGIPGLDLLDNQSVHSKMPAETSFLDGLLDHEPGDNDPPEYDPFEEPNEASSPALSATELAKLDEENDELMSILNEVLTEESLSGKADHDEFRFIETDPDNPGDFDIDSLFEEEDTEGENLGTVLEDDDIPIGEDEMLLNLIEGDEGVLSAEEILEQAVEYFRDNQIAEGISFLSIAVDDQPRETTLRYYHAYALARYANDYEAAKTQLETLLKQDNGHPDAWFLMAELAENQQDFEGAKKCFEKVIENQPEYPEAEYRLGILMADHFKGEEAAAAAHLKTAIQQDEQNIDAIYMLATLLNENLDQPENSVKHFRKVISIQPEHPFANYDLALVYHELGDKIRAAEFYQKAVSVNPELKTEQNDIAFEIPVLENKQVEKMAEAVHHEETPITNIIDGPKLEEVLAAPIEDETIETHTETVEKEASLETTPANNNGNGAETETAIEVEKRPAVRTKVVLITGGTAGIGKATAEVFAENGYQVLITGRRQDRLEEISENLSEKYNVPVLSLAFDVRDPEAVKTAFDDLPDEWKNVDILINNAGLSKGLSPIQEGDLEDWDAMIDTNIKGLLYVTRAISPYMVERKSGHIINVSSIAGTEVYPGGNVYCASKAAVSSLTRSMRLDLHQHNIRVSQVAPGHVEETEFARVRFDWDTEKAAKVYENFQPLKSSDVAETIYFIASRPPHINIQDIYMFGTQQASATMIDRSGR